MAHPPKAPEFGQTPRGMIVTDHPVQLGCAYCVAEGLLAPASGHVAYLWGGTSFCSTHLAKFFETQAAAQ